MAVCPLQRWASILVMMQAGCLRDGGIWEVALGGIEADGNLYAALNSLE